MTFVNNQLSFYFRSLKRLLELFNNSFPLFHLPLDLMDFFIINIYYNIVQVIYSCNFFQEIKRILCYRFSLKRWFNISSSWNSWKYPSTIIYMIMHTYLLLFFGFQMICSVYLWWFYSEWSKTIRSSSIVKLSFCVLTTLF